MRLLYIDIDTLRHDHLGCNGYHRDTSPNIDALAADGVRFTNVYASDVPCLPSRTALITDARKSGEGVIRSSFERMSSMSSEFILVFPALTREAPALETVSP